MGQEVGNVDINNFINDIFTITSERCLKFTRIRYRSAFLLTKIKIAFETKRISSYMLGKEMMSFTIMATLFPSLLT